MAKDVESVAATLGISGEYHPSGFDPIWSQRRILWMSSVVSSKSTHQSTPTVAVTDADLVMSLSNKGSTRYGSDWFYFRVRRQHDHLFTTISATLVVAANDNVNSTTFVQHARCPR